MKKAYLVSKSVQCLSFCALLPLYFNYGDMQLKYDNVIAWLGTVVIGLFGLVIVLWCTVLCNFWWTDRTAAFVLIIQKNPHADAQTPAARLLPVEHENPLQ